MKVKKGWIKAWRLYELVASLLMLSCVDDEGSPSLRDLELPLKMIGGSMVEQIGMQAAVVKSCGVCFSPSASFPIRLIERMHVALLYPLN